MLFGQRMAFRSFFVDFIGHFTLVDNSLLSDIGAVAVQRLAHILFFEQRFQLLGIVLAGGRYHPVVDEFGAFIDLDMVFFNHRASTSFWRSLLGFCFQASGVWPCLI